MSSVFAFLVAPANRSGHVGTDRSRERSNFYVSHLLDNKIKSPYFRFVKLNRSHLRMAIYILYMTYPGKHARVLFNLVCCHHFSFSTVFGITSRFVSVDNPCTSIFFFISEIFQLRTYINDAIFVYLFNNKYTAGRYPFFVFKSRFLYCVMCIRV